MTQTSNNDNRAAKLPPIRVTVAEQLTIKDKAQRAGLTLSEYTRRACLSGVVVARNAAAEQETKRIAFALAAIGNNLNQIARAANIHGGLDRDRAEQLGEVLGAVSDLLEGLR